MTEVHTFIALNKGELLQLSINANLTFKVISSDVYNFKHVKIKVLHNLYLESENIQMYYCNILYNVLHMYAKK